MPASLTKRALYCIVLQAIFSRLLQLHPTAHTSLHVLDCFLAFFVDINASAPGRHAGDAQPPAMLQVMGRAGQRPGCKLTGQALVGRRICVRLLEDNKMRSATVTGFDAKQFLKHTLVWDSDAEEVRKNLDESDAYSSVEWSLIEDDLGSDAASLHLHMCRNWRKLQGFDTLWNVALAAPEDAVAGKAASIITQLMLCREGEGASEAPGGQGSGWRKVLGRGMPDHMDAEQARGGDAGEGHALLVSLFGEIEAAARTVFHWEDLSMHELRKRARSLSLEMTSDMDGQERGSPGPASGRLFVEGDAVANDVAAALSAPKMMVSVSAGLSRHGWASADTVGDQGMHSEEAVDAGELMRLRRSLSLMLGILCEQLGAQSHTQLSRVPGAKPAGKDAGADPQASENSGYIDMSDASFSGHVTESEALARRREDQNRQELGAALRKMSEDAQNYNLLLIILEAPPTPAQVRDLVWKVLMKLPTLQSKYLSIEEQQFTSRGWSGVLGPETGPWRSLYALQIVDAMLLPGDDANQIMRAVDWRCKFLRTGGLDQLIAFAMTVDKHPSWHDRQPLARSVCLPLLARILKSCIAGALSDLKDRAGGMQRLTNVGRTTAVHASSGSQLSPDKMPMPAPEEATPMSLVDSVGSDDGDPVGKKQASTAKDKVLDIDMGLMTKQLLSFLLQDIAALGDEHRAAHTQALTDGEWNAVPIAQHPCRHAQSHALS